MKSFDEFFEENFEYGLSSPAKNIIKFTFEAGQQSKQAEVDELQKRIDELEGKNRILGMRLDVIQGVMQKEIDSIIKMKGDQS